MPTSYDVVYKREGTLVHAYVMFGSAVIHDRFLNADEAIRFRSGRTLLSTDLATFADANRPRVVAPPVITILSTDTVVLP